MTMRTVLHTLLVIWAVCWGAPVIAVPVGPSMNIDIPAANSVMPQMFQLAGWAVDTDALSGPGVDAIEVWGYPAPGSGAAPIYLGPAVYGVARPDVGQAFGAQFSNSGWYLNIVGRPPAVYEIHVYARSTVTGTFNQERALTVTVTADPRMSIDLPTASAVHQPFSIVGWAIDLASGSGTGVSTIHVWSRRLDVPESPDVFVGVAAYGSARPDVGAAFGARFTDSAYVQTVTGLAPGLYRFVVYARSTLTSTFNQAQVLDLDVDQSVAAPVFSMPAGTYAASFSLEAPTSTPQATVRYTTNGADPTTTSPTGPVWVDTSMTVKAKAFRTGWTPSTTTTAAYVLEVATPTVSVPAGAYTTDFSVEVTSPTSSSEVRYTTNGTEPTITSPLLAGLQYFVYGTVTLKVKAFRSGWTPSATTTAVYTRQPSPPVASPAGGTYAVGQVVMLTASGPIDLIRYTTDGMEPTASSPIFDSVNPLVLTEPITLRARSFHPQYAPSTEIQVAYVTRVATPTLSPNEGQYQTLPLVTITTATPSATIRYTTDRTNPTESSATYSSAIATQNFTSIRARAYKTGWAPSDVAVATYWDFTPPESSSATTVVSGVNPALPATVGGTVSIGVSGGGMITDPARVFAYRNGTRLSGAALQISAGGVIMPNVLVDGENRLELEALDQDGLLFNETVTVWAGNRTLTVTVRKRQGSATVTAATVMAKLQRASAVSAVGTTNGAGQLAVSSLPSSHEIALVVTAPGFRTSEATVAPTATSVTVYLDEATMAFASLAGWTVQTPRAWTQPHSEASTPLVPCGDCLGHDGSADPQQSVALAGDGAGNLDLVLDTKNLYGAQTVARTVAVAPGTSQVTARFRFQTDEMWWALPGRSPFAYQNDWFLVRLQPVGRPAEAVTYTRAVSQLLSAGQLDQYAATPWYTLSLPTQFTDAVEVTFTVANAVTNGHLSILQADVVQERTHRVAAVELRDLINANDPHQAQRRLKPLSFLSLSPMLTSDLTSYGGYIRVHGTITIEGPVGETLSDVWLEVWDNGAKIATAQLARAAPVSDVRLQLLNKPFVAESQGGTLGKLTVPELSPGIAPVLFEFNAASLSAIDQSQNSLGLVLQVHAKLANGEEIRYFDVPGVFEKLVQYTGLNRYGGRDSGNCIGLPTVNLPLPPTDWRHGIRWKAQTFPCGGDSWARPSTANWIGTAEAGTLWGDFSNMHGGSFPIHTSHLDGSAIDGSHPGYLDMGEDEAKWMVAFVRKYYTTIEKVLVGFSTKPNDNNVACAKVDEPIPASHKYWSVVRDALPLPDNRQLKEVIVNTAGHCDHFHVIVRRPPTGGSE